MADEHHDGGSSTTTARVDDVLRRSADERRRAEPVRRTIAGSGDVELDSALAEARRRLLTPDAPSASTSGRGRRSADPPSTADSVGRPADTPTIGADYRKLLAERRAIDAHDERVRGVVHDGIRAAVEDLRRAPSAWDLLAGAPAAVCGACGFTRSLVSAVRGSRWTPLVVHTREDLDPNAATFRSWVAEHLEIPLANMLGETEIVRRRAAMRFVDPLNDPRTFKPIIEAAGSPGYAAAPIVVGTRTLGFLHVDRVGQDQPITEDDRIALGAFTADLGWLFHRASSEELLAARAAEIEAAIGRARTTLARAASPEPETVIGETTAGGAAPAAGAPARRDALLTAREREILELVADGATNWSIAQRLTLSEDTVKAHVRTIRRKLHVKSRGAAVARYRRLREDARG